MADGSIRPRVAVLLATYNGMRWINEQMRSILDQQGVDVTVFVSDDQSSDGTLEWCVDCSEKDTRIVILPLLDERFGGAARNFFRLIRDVNFSSFDYISYADQDDIWLSDKLISAHEWILEESASAYSGNVVAFWPDGREQILEKAQTIRKFDFLFEAGGPGCSYVLKVSEASCFKQFLVEHWTQANAVALHDWLTYAWFRSNGYRWVIDESPKIRYRQHGGNQIGANEGFAAVIRRLKMVRSGWYREQSSQVARLVAPYLSAPSKVLNSDQLLSRRFILSNINHTRRQWRDRAVLFIVVLLGIY